MFFLRTNSKFGADTARVYVDIPTSSYSYVTHCAANYNKLITFTQRLRFPYQFDFPMVELVFYVTSGPAVLDRRNWMGQNAGEF